jgi:hypothetical protein
MVTQNSWNSENPAQVAKGGTGAATLTGVLTGNGTAAVTANAVTQFTVLTGGASNAVTDSTASISSAGEMTNPSQPAFLGYLATSALNKTGTGTVYTIGTDALTEVYDQGSDFTTAGVFTAPVTGRYLFCHNAHVTGCTAASAIIITIITSNRSYVYNMGRGASGLDLSACLSCVADMDATDTMTFTVQAFGEAGDTDDIAGGAFATTYMSGCLLA